MEKTALITGASCGIGYEFAKIFAKNGNNVILVARSKDKLEKIKLEFEEKYKISAFIYPTDLLDENSAKELYEKIKEDGIYVDYLINNAGFGDNHSYVESEWKIHENMVKLNVLSLMELCHLFGKEMCERKNGKILNVASVAAFTGGPYMAVYYATKAFVLSFSEGIAEEFKKYGVTVTCLCPGPTESNFGAVSDFGKSNAFKYLGVAKAKNVAATGYKAMMKGKVLAYHGFNVKAMAFLTRFSPRSINTKVSGYMDKH